MTPARHFPVLAPGIRILLLPLFLDNRHRLIEFVELCRGTIDSAAVYPREVVKEAVKRNSLERINVIHKCPSRGG